MNDNSKSTYERTGFEAELERFCHRLEKAVGEATLTIPALAREVGVSDGAIRKWLKGESEPDVRFVLPLAAALGVRPEWLAFGAVPMRTGEDAPRAGAAAATPALASPAHSAPYNRELLMGVVLGLEDYYERENKDPSPEQRAKLTVLMYDLFLAKGRLDRDELNSLLKIAA